MNDERAIVHLDKELMKALITMCGCSLEGYICAMKILSSSDLYLQDNPLSGGSASAPIIKWLIGRTYHGEDYLQRRFGGMSPKHPVIAMVDECEQAAGLSSSDEIVCSERSFNMHRELYEAVAETIMKNSFSYLKRVIRSTWSLDVSFDLRTAELRFKEKDSHD